MSVVSGSIGTELGVEASPIPTEFSKQTLPEDFQIIHELGCGGKFEKITAVDLVCYYCKDCDRVFVPSVPETIAI